jgi:hypothetical protein
MILGSPPRVPGGGITGVTPPPTSGADIPGSIPAGGQITPTPGETTGSASHRCHATPRGNFGDARPGQAVAAMNSRTELLVMACPSSRDPIEPMDLANMRQNGVRSLEIVCHQCRQAEHAVLLIPFGGCIDKPGQDKRARLMELKKRWDEGR